MGDPEYAEPLTSAPVLVDGVDSVQPATTDTDVGKPVKRRRLLSDKQHKALQIGRERRWKRAQEVKGVVFDNDVPIKDQLKESKLDNSTDTGTSFGFRSVVRHPRIPRHVER